MLYHKIRIELTSPCIADSIFSTDQLSASFHLIKFNAHSFLSKSVRSFLLIISLLHADFQTDLWQCGMSVNAVKSLYYHNKKLFRAIFTSNLQSSIRNHQYTRYAAPSYLISKEYLCIFLCKEQFFTMSLAIEIFLSLISIILRYIGHIIYVSQTYMIRYLIYY